MRGDHPVRLLTVGHGTASAEQLSELLRGAGVEAVVDVRSAPESRRHPQFGRSELEQWLPEAVIAYRWEPQLGGFRRPQPGSTNVALRNQGFRGYADYMESDAFTVALARLLQEAHALVVAAMCAETLWWRCHRRLIADAAVLLQRAEVWHLDHQGHQSPHRLTDGVRLGGGHLVYDAGGPAVVTTESGDDPTVDLP